MHRSKPGFSNAQRGVSLSGLIFMLAIIAVIAMFAMKVFPTFIEYRAIKSAIVKVKASGGTPQAMRMTFAKAADIGMISSVKPSDLIITRDGGEAEVSFSYENRIPLFANVSLVILYSGTTDKSGIVPDKASVPPERN